MPFFWFTTDIIDESVIDIYSYLFLFIPIRTYAHTQPLVVEKSSSGVEKNRSGYISYIPILQGNKPTMAGIGNSSGGGKAPAAAVVLQYDHSHLPTEDLKDMVE